METAEDPDTPPEVAEVARQAAANLAEPGTVVDREHRAVQDLIAREFANDHDVSSRRNSTLPTSRSGTGASS
jgi:hypothetical protein